MWRFAVFRSFLILLSVLAPVAAWIAYFCLAAGAWWWWFGLLFGAVLVHGFAAACRAPRRDDPHEPPWVGLGQFARNFSMILLGFWITEKPEVKEALVALQQHLWDWRPITFVSVFCLWWLSANVHAALAFRPVDLYPELLQE